MLRTLLLTAAAASMLSAGALERLGALPEDAVVAKLNGQPVTAREVKILLQIVDEDARKSFDKDPQFFLNYHAWMLRLQSEAEKRGLETTQPYKDQIAFERLKILARAALDDSLAKAESTNEEVKSLYERERDRFRESKVRMIYIPFANAALAKTGATAKTLTEAEAKAKAEAIVRRARAGEEFIKLAQEANPGELQPVRALTVRPGSANPPEAMKAVILKTDPGRVTDPLRHENGFYIFQVDSMALLPLHEVSSQLHQEIREARYRNWREQTQRESVAVIEEKSLLGDATAKK